MCSVCKNFIIFNETQVQCILVDELIVGNRLLLALQDCRFVWKRTDVLSAESLRPRVKYLYVNGEWIKECDVLVKSLEKCMV